MDKQQIYKRALEVMSENFGHVTEICLASGAHDVLSARDVNAYYVDGKFYVLSRLGNSLMNDVQVNPNVALCHGSHNMRGVVRSLGHPLDVQNYAIRREMKKQFSLNYNEYASEDDPDMRILEITLTYAQTYTRFHRYEIDYVAQTATRDHAMALFIYR